MKNKDVFDQYSEYYNLLYSNKDYDSEVDYIEKIIKKFGPDTKTILEYGSGTGGHGLLLKKKGYTILGIEQSEKMASIALGRGYDCQVDDITTFQVNRTFDACIALFHVISYINSNEGLLSLFSNTKKHLKSRGIFIFDVWFTPAVLHKMPAVRVKRIDDNKEFEVIRIAEPTMNHSTNTVEVNYQILVKNKESGKCREFNEVHKMRHFGIPEIALLANQTGFSIIKTEEFLTGKGPSVETWGVNFILQANE